MRLSACAALLALAACGGGDDKAAVSDSLPPAPAPVAAGDTASAPAASASAASAPSASGIEFDPRSLEKGTQVGTVKADMLVLSKAVDSSWVGSARFSGELTLSGRAIPHFDSNVPEVCFEADAASAALLPHWAGDTRRPWFCFSNQPEAQETLAALRETRAATVVIDEFTINKGLSDQVNTARLVRVVKR